MSAALLASLAVAGAARAAQDASEADSSGVEIEAAADSQGVTREEWVRTPLKGAKPAAPSRFDAPRWVMMRDMVFPGWGQAANGAWLKAGLVAAGEFGLAWRLFDDRQTLDRIQRQVDEARAAGDDELENNLINSYNSRLDSYTGRQWLLGGIFVYSLLDAYIDAHFRNFKAEFESDPALPGGTPPPASARVGLRFQF